MRHTSFGRVTGLRVSEYALGTGNFGTAWGGGAELPEARAVFDRFAEAGGTFIDTADVYSNGDSERILGEFLATDRDHFVVATKYGLGAGATDVSTSGASRRNMIRSVEASLRRLRTDRVDLLWTHWPDPTTPTDEILAGFDHLVSAGKVLHAGLSNFPAWQVSHAAAVAALRGWAPLAAVQFEYSLAERTADRELLPMARAHGLGVNLWSPLGGGLLTGKYRTSRSGRLTDWNGGVVQLEDTEQRTAVLDAVLDVAGELALTPAQVAMAWLLHAARAEATSVVPVIGPRNLAQLDDYLAALDVTLPAEHLSRLNKVSAPSLGVPHEGIARVTDAVLGGDRTDVTVPPLPLI